MTRQNTKRFMWDGRRGAPGLLKAWDRFGKLRKARSARRSIRRRRVFLGNA